MGALLLALLLAALPAGATYPTRRKSKTCVGASCPITKEADGEEQDDAQADEAIIADARKNPDKYTPGSDQYWRFMTAFQNRVHAADFGKGPEAERKRQLRDLVVALQAVDPDGAKYIQTKNFGIISPKTPVEGEPTAAEVIKQTGGGVPQEKPVFGGTATKQEGQQPPPGAPKDAEPGTILTQAPSGQWSALPPAEQYSGGGDGEGGGQDGKGGKTVSKSVSSPTGGGGGAAGLGSAAGSGLKGFGADAAAKLAGAAEQGGPPKDGGMGKLAPAKNDPSRTAAQSGGGPGSSPAAVSSQNSPQAAAEIATAVASAASAASLPASAQAAAKFGPLPKAVQRRPDYFDPARGGIAPERFNELKADYARQPELRDTDFKHVALSADGRDFERTQNCDIVSGGCNRHAEKSYKKDEEVPPKDLNAIWKSVRAYIKAKNDTQEAASSAEGRISADGVWSRLRSLFGGGRNRGARAVSAGEERAGYDRSGGEDSPESRQYGTAGAVQAAASTAGRTMSEPGAGGAAPRRAGHHMSRFGLFGLVVGAALVCVPIFRRNR